MSNRTERILRNQAVERALGEINAAIATFYDEEEEKELYKILIKIRKLIKDYYLTD